MSGRYFTVKDSIEMARFGRTDYEPQFSPDGKYFAVVTSRGIIETNEVESMLRIFATEATRECLRKNVVTIPAPKVVARLAAIPSRPYYSSYGPIISDVKWTPDSKAILFLAQNSSGKRQLYRADVNMATAKAVTSPDRDVSQFDFAGGTIAYRVTQFEGDRLRGDPINADAHDITGMDITAILFPNSSTVSNHSVLWVSRGLRSQPVIDSRTGQFFHLWDEPPAIWNTLSISPDGKSVVALVPVKEVPQSWEHYEPKYSATSKIHAQDPNHTADSNPVRLTQYAVIDLTTGLAKALVDAPNGWALGYNDRNRATWSSDGKKLLLINTFLPLEGADESEKLKRVRPCAAAVVELISMTSRCVSYGHVAHVWNSYFGKTSDDVVLQFDEQSPPEKFYFQKDTWQPEVPLASQDQSFPSGCIGPRQNLSGGLLIEVAQDMNDPPVLSATDCATGRHRKIWNPNPQLANIKWGEASIIKWKDASGYEWKGALLKPPDYVPGQRYPLVIQTYGFVEKEFLTDGQDTTAFAARPLAAADIVVLLFWHRFDHGNTAQEAPDQILGYESAIEQLVSSGLVDAEKVGIIGFSRTCYHVESALIKRPSRFAAATIADGVGESYFQSLFLPALAKEGEAIYGAKPFGKGLGMWIDRAPGFNLDRVQTPLRIEAIGPASVLFQWEIYASLWQQKKPVDLIYIPGGQHILQKPLDRVTSQQGNVDWFRFWLKGEEDPDPSKVSQYLRWRQLRSQYIAENGNSRVSQ
jgi:dipeptidyl aminopeptidase/acylaminoacyl peptidase